MRIRSLYLSIYLTVVAVLAVFALVAAFLWHFHADAERERLEQELSRRAVSWAQLIEKALPPMTAPEQDQRDALLDWGRRLRLALALETADGRRIASSPFFDEPRGGWPMGRPSPARVTLSDGRVLVVQPLRMMRRPDRDMQRGFEPRPEDEGMAPGEERGPARSPSIPMGRAPDIEGGGGRPQRGDEPFRPEPPPGESWWRGAWWLGWLGTRGGGGVVAAPLALLFLAIAAGSYPVVRRLTRRLEALQRGVEIFGAGQLSHRVPQDGGDEVASLAASFNQAAQRVEGLVRAHRSLLANASHELRSPLARMKMALAMLEDSSSAQQLGLREEMHRNIRELDALVEEILLASRLDARTPVSNEPFDLLGVAAEEAVSVDAELEVDEAARHLACRGDERLLRRALRNLLENARRYGGGEVSLLVGADSEQTSEPFLLLKVCDRGSGVPAAERERIFEPFYRMPGHSEQAGGVGLGLSLVRQIAQRLGGSVQLDDREGGGSCFTLRLPVAGRSDDPAPSPDAPARHIG